MGTNSNFLLRFCPVHRISCCGQVVGSAARSTRGRGHRASLSWRGDHPRPPPPSAPQSPPTPPFTAPLRSSPSQAHSQQPTANSQQPTYSKHTANSQQPIATASSQQPRQQPTANSQQPTANLNLPISSCFLDVACPILNVVCS